MAVIDDIHAYFEKHPEKTFLVKAFVTIAVILWVKEVLILYLFSIFLLFILVPFTFISWLYAWSTYTGDSVKEIIKRNLTLLPAIYSDEKAKGKTLPWVTYSLVFINIAVFFLVQNNPLISEEVIGNNFIFLPYKPNFWNVPVSLFTRMFLHGSTGHLMGNMFFLWGIGTEVERRIGSRKFAMAYIVTGLLAGIGSVVVNILFMGKVGHSWGASGAIAGIMGVFAVRCYFKTMIFPIPILGVLPINFKIRMNSLVMMGLFFARNLGEGIDVLSGQSSSNVGHWAHLSGMFSGMIIAGCLKMGDSAIEEKHTEIGLQHLRKDAGFGEGEKSLRKALEMNEDNVEAMLTLARMKSKNRYLRYKEGAELYRKVIRKLLSEDPNEAADVFVEYCERYKKIKIEPSTQLRLAGILRRNGKLKRAAWCAERLSNWTEAPRDIREKALFQAAMITEEMNLADAAKRHYRRFLRTFPDSSLVPKIKAKLDIA